MIPNEAFYRPYRSQPKLKLTHKFRYEKAVFHSKLKLRWQKVSTWNAWVVSNLDELFRPMIAAILFGPNYKDDTALWRSVFVRLYELSKVSGLKINTAALEIKRAKSMPKRGWITSFSLLDEGFRYNSHPFKASHLQHMPYAIIRELADCLQS